MLKLPHEHHSASRRFAWFAAMFFFAFLEVAIRSSASSEKATTPTADRLTSSIVADADLDKQQTESATLQLKVLQRLREGRRHQIRRHRHLEDSSSTSSFLSSSSKYSIFKKGFAENLSHRFSRPAWWRPWWMSYRLRFRRRLLKKCASFNGIAPPIGSACPKKNRPRSFGYFCMFGEQRCVSPTRGIFGAMVHPTTRCDCSQEGVWDCQDWDPQCDAEIVTPCNSHTSCLDCVSNGCGWSQGCLDDCTLLADEAPCYSGANADAVCQQEEMNNQDRDECSLQTSCNDCVSTTLPSDDSRTCQWADFGDDEGGLCLSTCALLCGSTECPIESSCEERSTCLDCVSNGCGWTGGCLENCALIADAPCFEGSSNFQEICQDFEDDVRDSGECSLQTTCADCVATTLPSDESRTCVWANPESPETLASGPSSGICQSTYGLTGGARECREPCNDQTTCFDCVSNGCGWFGSCLDDCSLIADARCYSGSDADAVCQEVEDDATDFDACSSNTNCGDCVGTTLPSNDSKTCLWSDFGTDDNGEPSGLCSSFCGQLCGMPECLVAPEQPSCEDAVTCFDCISRGCEWSIGRCWDDCSIIQDAACYSTNLFVGQSPEEICQAEEDEQLDQEACSSITNCGDCVGTPLPSDESSTCQWFTDEDSGGGSGFCQSSCGLLGCGSTECAPVIISLVCQATDCLDCVSEGCGWAVGSCLRDCSNIADAPCYSMEFFPSRTPAEVCQAEVDARTNAEACGNQSNCEDCVATTFPAGDDPSQTCLWLEFRGGGICQSLCGLIGCGTPTCPAPERP